MVENPLSQSLIEAGWLTTVTLHALILLLLGWTFLIHWLRVSTDRRRQQMVAVWRPILVCSLIEAPSALPPIHPRDRILFLYLWNHLRETITGESAAALCTILRRTGMDQVVHRYLATGTLRQQLLAIVTLGHLKEQTVWSRLADLSHDTNAFRSIEAARALVRIDPARAIPTLIPLISNRSDWSSLKILTMLQEAGEDLVAHTLGQAAADAPSVTAARLIQFLASVRNHQALPFIRPLLNRQPLDENVLASCLSLLGQCADPYDLPIVRQYTAHPNWFIRVHAATALGAMGREEDAAILIGLINDDHWWVRHRAAEALSTLPTMTDDKLSLLVQTLPPGKERHILAPFIATRLEQSLAQLSNLPATGTPPPIPGKPAPDTTVCAPLNSERTPSTHPFSNVS